MGKFKLGAAALCVIVTALAGCGGSSVRDSSSSGESIASATSPATDSSVIALSAAAYTVSAGASTAIINVYRTGASTGEVAVGYATVDGTALAGSDYQGTTGSVTWADGDVTSKSISVPVSASADGKSFGIDLSSVSGDASLGSPTQATVDITAAADGGSTNPTPSGASTSGSSASASGSTIPSATQLVDSAGHTWTVVGGVIYLDGVADDTTQQVILLLYYGGVIYQENSHCLWWSWTASAWKQSSQPAVAGIPACGTTSGKSSSASSSGSDTTSGKSSSTSSSGGGTTSGKSSSASSSSGTTTSGKSSSGTGGGSGSTTSHPAASPSGTMIPSVSKLVDSAGNSWTVNGGVIALDGAAQTNTQQVIVLLYYNGVIYQENSHCGWWSWTGGTWVASGKPNAGGIPACSSSVTSAASGGAGSGSATSTTSTSSSSATSSTSDGSVPAAAAAVGYNTNTFNSVVFDASSGPWYGFDFYGMNATLDAGQTALNADGSLSVPGTTTMNSGGNIATAHHASNAMHWEGLAFGGGAYFEAVISFENQNNTNFPNGGPAFWALDVEHSSQGPYSVSWPGVPNNSAGQPYDDFFEVDFMEYDFIGGYQFGIGNWYGYPKTKSTSNPTREFSDVVGSLLVPAGTDFSQPHRYGTLWVPATGSGQSTTTQGYLQNYFDGVPLGPKFYWDYHDPNDSGYPAPAPVNGSTAMSGMDWRHLFLMLGTEPQHPMTVYSVKVWQASAANNLTQ